MIRIVFICSLISIARSEQCSLNATELSNLQKTFTEASAYMKNQDKSNAVVYIGAARAGKSTLINYLVGNKLKVVRSNRKMVIELEHNTPVGPEIGAGTLSKTTMPSKWNSNLLPGLALWDSPGFGDNRGPVTDITNAFFLYQLLKNVDALKIALVISYDDIVGDNIQSFLNLLKNLENFFGDSFQIYFSSITVIFSKTPYKDDGEVAIDNKYMSELLDEQVLKPNIPDISETCRNFVKYIIENTNRIAFFRKAIKLGELPSNIADNIVEAINDSTFIGKDFTDNFHPSISQTSKLCLYSARRNLLSAPKLGELQTFVLGILTTQHENIKNLNIESSDRELDDLKNNLQRIKALLVQFVANDLKVLDGIELIKSIDHSVKNKIEQDNLVTDLNLILFVDDLLQAGGSEELKLAVKTIITASLAIVENSITGVLFKEGSITRERYTRKIEELQNEFKQKLDDLNKKMEEEKNKNKGGALHFILDPVINSIETGVNYIFNGFKNLFS